MLADHPDDPMRTFVRQILGCVAQLDRATTKKRLRDGRAAKQRAGGYAGGRPGYGHQAVGRELAVNPDEAPILSMVADMRRDGASLREVADALNAAGHTNRAGRPFAPTTVARIARRAGVS